MEHQDQIAKFQKIYAEHGLVLTEEEAAEHFHHLYAFLRLLFQKEQAERRNRLDKLVQNEVADIIH